MANSAITTESNDINIVILSHMSQCLNALCHKVSFSKIFSLFLTNFPAALTEHHRQLEINNFFKGGLSYLVHFFNFYALRMF